MDEYKKYERCKKILKGFAAVKVFTGWIIIIVIAFYLDICKKPYCCEALENLFSYQLGNLVAVIVVIWTATLSVCIYLWGKLDEQYFGIRVEKILSAAKEEGLLNFLFVIYIGAGLIVLIVATVVEMPILLFVDAVLQIFTMIWIALFTATHITRENVLRIVKLQIAGKKEYWDSNDEGLMFFSILQHFLFSDECEYDMLLKIIIEDIPEKERENGNSSYLFKRMNHIVYFILLRLNNSTRAKIKELLMGVYDRAKLKAVKWGVLSALMDQGTPWSVRLCINLIVIEKETEMVYQGALFILVRNLYVEDIRRQRWRGEYTRIIKEKFWLKISGDDQKAMVKLLKEMYENRFPGKGLEVEDSDGIHIQEPVYKLLFHDVFEM